MDREAIAKIETHCRQLEFNAKALRKALNKVVDNLPPQTDTPVLQSHEGCSGYLSALNAAIQVASAAHAALDAAKQTADTADEIVYAAGQLWFSCEYHEG